MFKVGDVVKLPRWCTMSNLKAVVIDTGSNYIGVRTEEHNDYYHDCRGLCEMGHGWYFSEGDLALITPAVQLSKHELLCNKVLQLQKKFNERNLVHDF